MSISVKKILEQQPVEASAPCRIDAGGTWDIKSLALPLEPFHPTTVNIAISLRTSVRLTPFREGRVKISSEGFSETEDYPHDHMPYHSSFGLFFAAISYFGFHGLQVHIRSDSPVKSALGGSSTALVALIKALSKIAEGLSHATWKGHDILHLAYHLEDGVSSGKCGIQDQAAAVFGGVNQWLWRFGRRHVPYERRILLDRKGRLALSERILVAFSGKSHVSSRINRKWIADFLSGKTRSGWMEVNKITGHMAAAIMEEKWDEAARLLQDEMTIRKKMTPDALIPLTRKLIDQAEKTGCGARFTGAGCGGSVWAIGRVDNVRQLRKVWKAALAPIRGAGILDCGVDPVGAR